ncbi:BsuBI/PstI family type II restriction endonuclease [Nonomuraea sp. NPDC051191]|uniref:BsuBI/PstI family type II restriction endonuclease n=1 Tax=Nonomuraea sp. NPDC051191 TaxID=3364372 RepID=UPI003791D377
MRDGIAARRDDESRRAYYEAARRSGQAIDKLCSEWGLPAEGKWYASDSREGPRDETLKSWEQNNAIIIDRSIKATSSVGRYTLRPEFARLFDPALDGEDLEAAIYQWQEENLTPIGRARAAHRAGLEQRQHSVLVDLPGGGTRELLPGVSSVILASFIEHSHLIMADPIVIFISQSGEPVNIVDNRQLRVLGLELGRLANLLPDALMVDISSRHLWFIEVVATDGPIDDVRRERLKSWAVECGVREDDCRFLTAFTSRTSGEAKKCLPRLARDSYAWFADEVDAILSWRDTQHPGSA